MTTNNEQLLEKIKVGKKTLISYYCYPTGASGYNDIVIETNNWNNNKHDEELKNFIGKVILAGTNAAGYHNMDNKVAVGVQVEGLEAPVYFHFHDNSYYISTGKPRQYDSVEPKTFNQPFND
jgi:hypothetical protein